MDKTTNKILRRILKNQVNMMIWLSAMTRQKTKPYYEGYFAVNIEETQNMIDSLLRGFTK